MLSGLLFAVAVTVPTYPGATAYCSQHVTGAPSGALPGPSISWTAYYTSDAPEVVAAWYQRRLPDAQHRREGREDIWRLPADKPQAVVSVTAVADAPPPLEACKQRVPAKARTLILLSAMTRPAPSPGQAQAIPRARPGRFRLIVYACPRAPQGLPATTSSSSAAASSAAASRATRLSAA